MNKEEKKEYDRVRNAEKYKNGKPIFKAPSLYDITINKFQFTAMNKFLHEEVIRELEPITDPIFEKNMIYAFEAICKKFQRTGIRYAVRKTERGYYVERLTADIQRLAAYKYPNDREMHNIRRTTPERSITELIGDKK